MFRLLGFPVYVRPGFVMLMVLIVVLYGDVFGLWLAGSLAAFPLLHELNIMASAMTPHPWVWMKTPPFSF